MVWNTKHLYIGLTAAIALVGCGGGGGGGSTDPDPQPTTLSVSGKAVDGYIKNATVCLDLSKDGVCQSTTEPTTTTDSDGDYALQITATHQAHANYATAQLLLYGGVDITTNLDFKGKLKAANNTSANITPITTLIAGMIRAGQTEDQAKEKLAAVLGISKDDLDKDPVAEAASGKKELLKTALQVQKSIELLASVETGTSGQDEDNAISDIYTTYAEAAVSASNLDTLIDAVSTNDNAKTAAKSLVENVAGAVDDLASTTEAALVIEKVKNDFKEDIDQGEDTFDDDAYKGTTVDPEVTLLQNLFTTEGITVDSATVTAIAALGDFTSAATLESVRAVIVNDPAYTGLLAEIDAVLQKKKEEEEAKNTIEGILNSDASATVDDAKFMMQQLRETAYTFASKNPLTGELNSSTIMGKQAEMIETRIVPEAKALTYTLKDSITEVSTMGHTFTSDLKQGLQALLDTLRERLYAIGKRLDISAENNTTTFGDTVDVNSSTALFTVTNSVSSLEGNLSASNEIKTVSTGSNLILKGTGYDLNVSELIYDSAAKRLKLTATATLTGTNSASAELTEFKLIADLSDVTQGDISFRMTGVVTAGGRSLSGNVLLSSDTAIVSYINGHFEGVSGEPVLEGNLTAAVNSNLFDTILKTQAGYFSGGVFFVDSNNKAYYEVDITDGIYDENVTVATATGTILAQSIYTLHNNSTVECNETETENYLTGTASYDLQCSREGEIVTVRGGENGFDAAAIQAVHLSGDNLGYVGGIEGTTVSTEQHGDFNLSEIDYFTISERVYELLDAGTFSISGHITDGNVSIEGQFSSIRNRLTQRESIVAEDVDISDGVDVLRASTLSRSMPYLYGGFADIIEPYTYNLYEEFHDTVYDTLSILLQNHGYSVTQIDRLLRSSYSATDLSLQIRDSEGVSLNTDMNLTVTNNLDDSTYSIDFVGAYHYMDTTFEGNVSLSGMKKARPAQDKEVTYFVCSDMGDSYFSLSDDNECDQYNVTISLSEQSLVGDIVIRGDVASGGFRPFVLDLRADVTRESAAASLYFSRGDNYKMAMMTDITPSDGNGTMNIGDNNGVKVGVTFPVGQTVTMKDKVGTPLGSISTGSGEITYSDGTAESL